MFIEASVCFFVVWRNCNYFILEMMCGTSNFLTLIHGWFSSQPRVEEGGRVEEEGGHVA